MVFPLGTVISHGLWPSRLAEVFVHNQLVVLVEHLDAVVGLQVPVVGGVHFYADLSNLHLREVRDAFVAQLVAVPFVVYALKSIRKLHRQPKARAIGPILFKSNRLKLNLSILRHL